MTQIIQKLCRYAIFIIEALSAALFIILALSAFLKTAYVEDAYQIPILLTLDNPVLNLLFLAVFLCILFILAGIFLKIPGGRKILLLLACLWVFGLSMLWVWLSKSGPAFDSGSVYYAAKQFARSDFSALSYRDSYFSVYPFQLGLAFFYELLFRVAGSDNFHILQGANAICLMVITISQYHLTWRFTHSEKAQIYGLLLTISCLPLIMYGSYIYGEIPSFAFLIFGTWMILLFLEEKKWFCGIPGFVSIVCSVMVRQNTLIFLIALGIIVFLYLVLLYFPQMNTGDLQFLKDTPKTKGRLCFAYLLYFVLLFALSVQIIPLVQQFYANRSQTEINAGVPTSTYLAMGLMEGDACPGGYTGYNFETFTVTADYDSSLASRIGWEDFRERLSYFGAHPGYAASFFGTKFLDQWLNAGWAIFDSTYVSFGERSPIIESCFSGALYPVLIAYMSNYQMVLYFLVALYAVWLLFYHRSLNPHQTSLTGTKASAKPIPVPAKPAIPAASFLFSHVFLLTAVGGALFYLAWEASGRYILPYAVFVLPCAAGGLNLLDGFLHEFIKKRRHPDADSGNDPNPVIKSS